MKTLILLLTMGLGLNSFAQCKPNDIRHTPPSDMEKKYMLKMEYSKYVLNGVSMMDFPVIYYEEDGYWVEVDFGATSKYLFLDGDQFIFYGPVCATYAYGNGTDKPTKFEVKKPKFKVE